MFQFVLGLNGKEALNRYLRKEVLGEEVTDDEGEKGEKKIARERKRKRERERERERERGGEGKNR